MSTTDGDAPAVAIAAPAQQDVQQPEPAIEKDQRQSSFLHSPPTTNNTVKSDASDSELSDLEDVPDLPDFDPHHAPAQASATEENLPPKVEEQEEEDIGEVEPHHWSGNVPVFMPTMHQFKDFDRFVRCRRGYSLETHPHFTD